MVLVGLVLVGWCWRWWWWWMTIRQQATPLRRGCGFCALPDDHDAGCAVLACSSYRCGCCCCCCCNARRSVALRPWDVRSHHAPLLNDCVRVSVRGALPSLLLFVSLSIVVCLYTCPLVCIFSFVGFCLSVSFLLYLLRCVAPETNTTSNIRILKHQSQKPSIRTDRFQRLQRKTP